MRFSKICLIAVAAAAANTLALAKSKTKSKKQTPPAPAPSVPMLCGSGFNALTINDNALAVINGGTYDASCIVSEGEDFNGIGMYVGSGASATVCAATLFKGGPGGNDKNPGVYVDAGATLAVKNAGVIEGGECNLEDDDGYGLYVRGNSTTEAKAIIAGDVTIRGGLNHATNLRTSAIHVELNAMLEVYGGEIGNNDRGSLLITAANNGTAQAKICGGIYKGEWFLTSIYNGTVSVNVYGKNLVYDVFRSVVEEDVVEKFAILKGDLCDGSKINVFVLSVVGNATASSVNLFNDCTKCTVPTFAECGGGVGQVRSVRLYIDNISK